MKKILCEENFRSLGTDICLKVVVDTEEEKTVAKSAIKEVIERYKFYHEMLSRFDSGSEISKVNENIGSWQDVSSEIFHLAEMSIEYNNETGGIFDPRTVTVLENSGYDKDFSLVGDEKIPTKISTVNFKRELGQDILLREGKVKLLCKVDFTGIAKGYITDEVTSLFLEKGFTNFLVDSGGDIYASGKNNKNESWRISLEGYSGDKFLMSLSDRGIATSGITRKRWSNKSGEVHHLIDPRDPYKFSFELQTVTVIEGSVETADAWSKTLFILGIKEGLSRADKDGISAIFLDARGNVTYSKKSKKFINIMK